MKERPFAWHKQAKGVALRLRTYRCAADQAMKVWPCVVFTSVKRPTTFWYLYNNWMVFAASGFKDSSQMCVLSVAAVPIIRGHHILGMCSKRVSRTSVHQPFGWILVQ